MARTLGDGGGRGDGLGNVGDPLPSGVGAVAVGVGEKAAGSGTVRGGDDLGAAENVDRAILRRGGGKDARGAGPGVEDFPSGLGMAEIEPPEVVHRAGGVGSLLAARDVDRCTEQGGAGHGAGLRQIGELLLMECPVLPLEPPDIAVMALGIAAAEKDEPLFCRNAAAVGERVLELEVGPPGFGVRLEDVDVAPPLLGPALKRRGREVRAACDHQRVIGYADERPAEAEGVGRSGRRDHWRGALCASFAVAGSETAIRRRTRLTTERFIR